MLSDTELVWKTQSRYIKQKQKLLAVKKSLERCDMSEMKLTIVKRELSRLSCFFSEDVKTEEETQKSSHFHSDFQNECTVRLPELEKWGGLLFMRNKNCLKWVCVKE